MEMIELYERELEALNKIGFECRANGEPFSVVYEGFGSPESCRNTGYKGHADCGLSLEIDLIYDPVSTIWRRSDRLVNESDQVIRISNPKLTFNLGGNHLRIIAQRSSWCREAQEQELHMHCDGVTIGSKGRSCSEYVPHFAVHSGAGGCVFDLLPSGDWRVKFTEHSERGCLEIEIDRYEDEMTVELSPGESFELSLDCLMRRLDSSELGDGGYNTQLYAMHNMDRRRHQVLPVVYNTWFDRFHKISWESMETQLAAAKKIGCEVFVIDAGWYGLQADEWGMVGDWRENPNVFSGRSLSEFADLVRSKGLGFGLWIEPERVHVDAPIRQTHPDMFIAADIQDYYYPDLCKLEARNWVLSEMIRVIETYQVEWLKIDCNSNFSGDPYKLGHRDRLKAWYEILDEVARRFPNLVVEGCASGGLNSDLLTVSHFDTHFLSDTVDPVDTLRITMSGLCRLAPRMMYKWVVPYPTGNGWTPYGNDGFDTGDFILCPSDATSTKVSSYNLDFAARTAMTGVMGLSGNIAGLRAHLLDKLAKHVAFYKEHREFIMSSVGIPLTPTEPIDKRDGIAAIQLSDRDFRRSMIFLYNISSKSCSHLVRPVQLNPDDLYRIADEDGELLKDSIEGYRLLDGLDVACETGRSRVIFVENISSIAAKTHV